MNKFKYLIARQFRHVVKEGDRFSFFRKPIKELQDYLERGYWDDILQSLITQEKGNPADKIETNVVDGTVDFKDNTDLTNYVVVNIQLPHGWVVGSDVLPHLHWFQKQDKTPNFLIDYRWQINGEEKTTDWSRLKWNSNAFTYPDSGSPVINQITSFPALTKPSINNISDIIQFKIIRDNANTSTLFNAIDDYTDEVSLVNFDLHILKDMRGSRTEFVK